MAGDSVEKYAFNFFLIGRYFVFFIAYDPKCAVLFLRLAPGLARENDAVGVHR